MVNYSDLMLKENALRGKSIIITGGGTGLGKSMAECFSMLGANIVICSRNKEVLEKTAGEISKKTGNEVYPIVCDVREHEQVENVIFSAINKFQHINILLNNAAGNFVCPTERLSHKAFDTIIDIVLKGTSNFTLALGKYWIKEKIKGNILNIITTYASTGSGFVVPSAAAKAGVLAMTRSLAVEWSKYHIRSNAIAPGPFPTPGAWEKLFPHEISHLIDPIPRIPMKRLGHHHELANLASFLVSDFSEFINGEVVTIDGGEWLQGAGEFNLMEQVPMELWDKLDSLRKK